MRRLLEIEDDLAALGADDFAERYRFSVERDGLKGLIDELEDTDRSVNSEWETQAERHRDEFEIRKGYIDERAAGGSAGPM